MCRKTTERGEGVGTFAFLCEYPNKLPLLFEQLNADYIPVGECPYGDGYAAEKILRYLSEQGF